jgi:hypothetical protein
MCVGVIHSIILKENQTALKQKEFLKKSKVELGIVAHTCDPSTLVG